jgi:hypothetical protein
MKSLKIAAVILAMLAILCTHATAAKQDQELPKEHGFYAKTGSGLQRITPNILFDQNGVLYVESNAPQRFSLSGIQHFVIYGKNDLTYLTFNPMLFFQQSPFGGMRFVLGKEIPIEIKKMGEMLYSIKPRSLFGRGYYAFWLDDVVWDFIIE